MATETVTFQYTNNSSSSPFRLIYGRIEGVTVSPFTMENIATWIWGKDNFVNGRFVINPTTERTVIGVFDYPALNVGTTFGVGVIIQDYPAGTAGLTGIPIGQYSLTRLTQEEVDGYATLDQVYNEMPREGLDRAGSTYDAATIRRIIGEISSEMDLRIGNAGVATPIRENPEGPTTRWLRRICLRGVVARLLRGLYRDEASEDRAQQYEQQYYMDVMRIVEDPGLLNPIGRIQGRNIAAPAASSSRFSTEKNWWDDG